MLLEFQLEAIWNMEAISPYSVDRTFEIKKSLELIYLQSVMEVAKRKLSIG